MPDDSTPSNEGSRRAIWQHEVRARLERVPLSPAREAEIVEELSQHLDDRWRELVASGTDPDAAGEVALAELHADALTRYLSPLRQARWTDPAPPAAGRPFSREGLMLDLRQAVRALRATPGFTIAALVVLALGIGATTAIFSVVDAVVLRPLPFDEPDQIVAVGERLRTPMGAAKGSPSGPPSKSGPGGLGPVGKGAPAGKSVPVGMPVPPGMDARDPQALNRMQPQNFLDLTAQQASFESMAAIADAEMALQLPGSVPEDVTAERVSAGFFDVLRIRPAAGRVFTAENENDGRDRVAIVSDVFWRQRLGGTDDVIGRTIRLDGDNYEVIGILPPHVTYPVGAVRPAELLVPYVVPENERTRGRGISIYLHSIARLKPGVTLAQAQSELDRIADAIAAANPGERRLNQFGVRPLHDHLVGASIRSWMVMLLAAVGIVLLIACANVANLLLARASAREREVAVRAALGAGRWRLVRQFLVESLVLAVVGTALGVIVAWWVVQALRGAMPEGVPRAMDIALDLRVLIAAVAVSAMTGLLFGIVPALQLSRPNLTEALSDGTRSASAGRGRQRLRAALVISEVALAVVLLVGAGLFIGSFISVMRVDPGFSSDRVITMQLYARSQEGQRPPDWSGAFEQIVERLNHTSGIVRAGAVSPGIPLRVNLHIDGLARPGRQLEGDTSISLKAVTPGYHQSLSIPLKSGRLFDATDRAESTKVVILNESAARTFFPDEDPVGQTVILSRGERTVVGVVGDVRQWSLETGPRTEAYLPMAQAGSGSGYLVVHSTDDPRRLLPAIKTAVASVLPDVPLRYVATMESLVAQQTAERRLNMLMLGLFGLLGLVISAVGVYGVMAYAVAQRTREIGVRMALGATRTRVVTMILTNAALLVTIGLAIGGIAAWYLSASARAFLFGLEPTDVRAFVAAAGTLAIAALIASAIPAGRAASVDPSVALRAE